MKLLFDQNLSHRLVSVFGDMFPGSEHVRNVDLGSADDDDIWDFAKKNDFTIVSKDRDFFHKSMVIGHPPKVVWIRLGNVSTTQIEETLRNHEADLKAFVESSEASFLALS